MYAKGTFMKYSKSISTIILCIVLVDISSNAYQQIKTLNSYPRYSYSRDQYNISTSGFNDIVKVMREEESSFYRIHSTIRLTFNDSLRYGYKG